MTEIETRRPGPRAETGAGNMTLIVPPPTDPMAVARMLVGQVFSDADGSLTLLHHRGSFHLYDGESWPEAEDRRIRSFLYHALENAHYWKGLLPVRWEPDRRKIANVTEAVQALTHLSAHITPPAWLTRREEDIPAQELVAMSNGLLHIPTRKLIPHTPEFFCLNVLPFDFDPNAPKPERFVRFLAELWPDDDESQSALAEIFGYILSGDTRQQKIFALVGPKRAGKGTAGRVLTGLLGVHNVAAPTLAGLTTNFGLSPLIGKPLGLISDARLSSRHDGTVAVERLLSISGEDSITIDRKYKEPWTGRLPTRFMILTNEIPRFTDSSGALASRFVPLVLTNTFYGREDPTLTDTLLSEAPGIFNWALEGLDRLTDRGYFELPSSARDAVRQLEDLGSPVGAFVRDRCELAEGYEISKDALYEDWRHWCELEGRSRVTSKEVFVRDLRAAFPEIRAARPREGRGRVQVLRGLRLAEQLTGPLTTPDRLRVESDGHRSGSGVESLETHRSKDVVRDGQGSSELYPSTDDAEPIAIAEELLGTEVER